MHRYYGYWLMAVALLLMQRVPTIRDAFLVNALNIQLQGIVIANDVDFARPCGEYIRPISLGRYLESFLPEDTFSPDYGLSMGRYEWLRGNCKSAKQAWARASGSESRLIPLLYLGWMAENAGDHAGAIASWKSAGWTIFCEKGGGA